MVPKFKKFSQQKKYKKGTTLDHKDTFYADDSAFIFLSKEDLQTGTEFVSDTFLQFGLQVHLGDKETNTNSKTEAMYFPSHSNLRKYKNSTSSSIPSDLSNGSINLKTTNSSLSVLVLNI